MGGQACVFYGAAQFSKDVDLALLASEENFSRLLAALDELNAKRIAVPRFDPALLARGHAAHFRCQGGEADRLRVDVMTRLRDLPEFEVLWARRTTIRDEGAETFELLSLQDLVQAKKTQREKDWPIIDALVEAHYRALGGEPSRSELRFGWRSLEPRSASLIWPGASPPRLALNPAAAPCFSSPFRAPATPCAKPSMPRSAPNRPRTALIGRRSKPNSKPFAAPNARAPDR